jgi:hypothetical protein
MQLGAPLGKSHGSPTAASGTIELTLRASPRISFISQKIAGSDIARGGMPQRYQARRNRLHLEERRLDEELIGVARQGDGFFDIALMIGYVNDVSDFFGHAPWEARLAQTCGAAGRP